MTKRYYICDVIGDGLTTETAFRPAIADYGVNWAASLPTDENGYPILLWTLAIVSTLNHNPLRGIQGVDQLPDLPMDDGIHPRELRSLNAILHARGLPFIGEAFGSYRKLIAGIGEKLMPNFKIDKLNVK